MGIQRALILNPEEGNGETFLVQAFYSHGVMWLQLLH